MEEFGVGEGALLHLVLVDTLVAEHGVEGRRVHDLHRESEHHENDEHARYRESLRQSFPSPNSVNLNAEKVDANLHNTEVDADHAVDCDEHIHQDIQEHLHVDDVVVLRRQSPQDVVQRVEELWSLQ